MESKKVLLWGEVRTRAGMSWRCGVRKGRTFPSRRTEVGNNERHLGDNGDRGNITPGIFFPWPQGAHGGRSVSPPKNVFCSGAKWVEKGVAK